MLFCNCSDECGSSTETVLIVGVVVVVVVVVVEVPVVIVVVVVGGGGGEKVDAEDVVEVGSSSSRGASKDHCAIMDRYTSKARYL